MKRCLDIFAALFGLIISLPFLAPLCLLVWLQDFHSPFYVPQRVGRKGRRFRMVKLRSMVIRADTNKVDSTAKNDPRITHVGRFIRAFKLDEVPQLWNVLIGDMSLVGPRPNVERETNLYTTEERQLLNLRPGMTDLSSIVFADEGAILEGKSDPDLAYNQLIRPWKSRLGLLYVKESNVLLDVKIILLTLVSIVSRTQALKRVARTVRELGGGDELVRVATRLDPLRPAAPPGATRIVIDRNSVPA